MSTSSRGRLRLHSAQDHLKGHARKRLACPPVKKDEIVCPDCHESLSGRADHLTASFDHQNQKPLPPSHQFFSAPFAHDGNRLSNGMGSRRLHDHLFVSLQAFWHPLESYSHSSSELPLLTHCFSSALHFSMQLAVSWLDCA